MKSGMELMMAAAPTIGERIAMKAGNLALVHALIMEHEAARITEQVLISGAFPQDFRVVHIYRVGLPFKTELR